MFDSSDVYIPGSALNRLNSSTENAFDLFTQIKLSYFYLMPLDCESFIKNFAWGLLIW